MNLRKLAGRKKRKVDERSIISEYLCGTEIDKICKDYKISRHKLYDVLRENGVNPNRAFREPTEIELKAMEEFKTSNLSAYRIAKKYNLSYKRFVRLLKRYGIYESRGTSVKNKHKVWFIQISGEIHNLRILKMFLRISQSYNLKCEVVERRR